MNATRKSSLPWNIPAEVDRRTRLARRIRRPDVRSATIPPTVQSRPRIHALRPIAVLLLTGCACQASARDRYSYFYNEGDDAIRSIQVKQQGVDRWTDVDVGEGLGVGKTKRLHLRAQGRGRCLYDVRTTFEKGPALLHRRMDLCAVATYSPERYRQFAIARARKGQAK